MKGNKTFTVLFNTTISVLNPVTSARCMINEVRSAEFLGLLQVNKVN